MIITTVHFPVPDLYKTHRTLRCSSCDHAVIYRTGKFRAFNLTAKGTCTFLFALVCKEGLVAFVNDSVLSCTNTLEINRGDLLYSSLLTQTLTVTVTQDDERLNCLL